MIWYVDIEKMWLGNTAYEKLRVQRACNKKLFFDKGPSYERVYKILHEIWHINNVS